MDRVIELIMKAVDFARRVVVGYIAWVRRKWSAGRAGKAQASIASLLILWVLVGVMPSDDEPTPDASIAPIAAPLGSDEDATAELETETKEPTSSPRPRPTLEPATEAPTELPSTDPPPTAVPATATQEAMQAATSEARRIAREQAAREATSEAQSRAAEEQASRTSIPVTVWCPDCEMSPGEYLPLILWSQPGGGGVAGGKVTHGTACTQTDRKALSAYDTFVKLDCPGASGWLREEGVQRR